MKVLVLRLVPERGLLLRTELDFPTPEFPGKAFLPRAAMELRHNLSLRHMGDSSSILKLCY